MLFGCERYCQTVPRAVLGQPKAEGRLAATITSLGVTDPMGNNQLDANTVTLRAQNGTTTISTLESDLNGNIKSPDLDTQGLKITVIVPSPQGLSAVSWCKLCWAQCDRQVALIVSEFPNADC